MTYGVFLSEKAQPDLDTFSSRMTNQIPADCSRLAVDPISDGKRIKKLEVNKGSGTIYRYDP